MKTFISEKTYYLIFYILLIFKAVFSALQIVVGILVVIIPERTIARLAIVLAEGELVEDPKDRVASYVIRNIGRYSVHSQNMAALYLLTHGIIKLLLVIALLQKKLWAYPVAIAVFLAFIIYQMVSYASAHSLWLLGVTAIDVFIVLLTIHEYRYIKKKLPN